MLIYLRPPQRRHWEMIRVFFLFIVDQQILNVFTLPLVDLLGAQNGIYIDWSFRIITKRRVTLMSDGNATQKL